MPRRVHLDGCGGNVTETVGPYRLVRHLATGGMAEVWLARHQDDEGREVALKRILPHLARDNRFTTMFIDEAEIGSKLRHENIVEVLDVGQDDGEFFIAMEYVEGPDLAQILDRCEATGFEVSVGVASRIVVGVLRALDYAHEFSVDGTPMDIVHRDVSPHNILVTGAGLVKLIDFGVAKAVERHAKTETGFVKGKLSYMAPEQIEQESLDRRADIFGVGALFFELLTGRTPFGRELTAVSAILSEDPPDLRLERGDVPEEIVAAIERSLEKSADDRFPTASAMADAVEAALSEHDSSLAAVSQFLAELEAASERDLRETSDMRVEAPTNPATPVPHRIALESSRVELTGALAAGAEEPGKASVALPMTILILLIIGFGSYLGRHQIAAVLAGERAFSHPDIEDAAENEGSERAGLLAAVEHDAGPSVEEREAPTEFQEGPDELVADEGDEGDEGDESDEVEKEGFSFGEDEAEAVYTDAAALRKVELEKPPENWLNEFWVPALIDSVAEPAPSERRWDPGNPEIVDVLDFTPRPDLESGEEVAPVKKKRPKRRVKRRPRKRTPKKEAPRTQKPDEKSGGKKKRDGYKRMENALPSF